MKKKIILSIVILSFLVSSCGEKWLDIRPEDSVDQYSLANEDGINALLIGAYSMLDGVSEVHNLGWEAASSNWLYGSIRGMEANKGTDAGDSNLDLNVIQTYSESADNIWHQSYLNIRWESIYESISRCNSVILVTMQALEDGTISQESADLFLKQARVLRGWFHFEAWRMWGMIPYVDENTDKDEVTNTVDIRDRIIADLQEGTFLPNDMQAIGRFNGTVSKVLLAKALMQMYHDYEQALILLTDVKANGTKPDGSAIGLAPTYGEIFDMENRNGIEAVYTVQYSVNDGSRGWNGGYGEVLNYPYKFGASPGGCCGFFQPTQEFVNSFRTDENGLPMLDFEYNMSGNVDLRDQGVTGSGLWDPARTYNTGSSSYYTACTAYNPAEPFTDLGYVTIIDNNTGNDPLTSPAAWELRWTEDNSRPTDPRLDWTVGRRGIPYWDWGVHTGSDWIRDQSYAGPYSPKKQVYKRSQEARLTEMLSWTWGFSANGYRMIRFADVLLLLAECQIETDDLNGALENINAVRARAANPAGYVKESDGITPSANYKISLYPSFPDIGFARKALRMERKLELGMEGHRWFDLNRWGITVEELNRTLDYEKTMPWGEIMYGDCTVGSEDVTYPIPKYQLDLSNGRLVQNR